MGTEKKSRGEYSSSHFTLLLSSNVKLAKILKRMPLTFKILNCELTPSHNHAILVVTDFPSLILK